MRTTKFSVRDPSRDGGSVITSVLAVRSISPLATVVAFTTCHSHATSGPPPPIEHETAMDVGGGAVPIRMYSEWERSLHGCCIHHLHLPRPPSSSSGGSISTCQRDGLDSRLDLCVPVLWYFQYVNSNSLRLAVIMGEEMGKKYIKIETGIAYGVCIDLTRERLGPCCSTRRSARDV